MSEKSSVSGGRRGRAESIRQAAARRLDAMQSSAPRAEAHGRYVTLMLDEIRPDPENPRWGGRKGLTLAAVQNPDTIEEADEREEAEAIRQLAYSIGSVGLRQPIEVWRNQSWYQIVDGERRYWALRLLGVESVEVHMLHEQPSRLRLVQLITNAQREDLGLREQLHNLDAVVQESASLEKPIETGSELAALTGFGRSRAFEWWSVLSGSHPSVREAIEAGKIGSYREMRTALKAANNAGVAKRGGRPATGSKVALGSVSIAGLRELLALLGEADKAHLGDEKRGELSKRWRAALKRIEAQERG